MRLERVGVFTYSDEDGTPAVKLNPKIDPEVQQQRLETLMLAQQQVAFEWNRTRVGQELEVLIDGFDVADDGSARLYGRSYAEAPEIDSRIYLPAGSGQPGEYVRVRIAEVEDYDLVAAPISEA